MELQEPVQINVLLGRIKVVYTLDPLIHRGTFYDPQGMLETMGSTKSYVDLIFP